MFHRQALRLISAGVRDQRVIHGGCCGGRSHRSLDLRPPEAGCFAGKIMFLKAELEHMHAFLAKMSGLEDPDELDKCWIKEVRELSYDIEDSIDDFALLFIADDKSARLTGFKGFIEKAVNLVTNGNTRRQVTSEAKRLKVLVTEVGERHARYKIDNIAPKKARSMAVDPRISSLYNDVSQLVGTEKSKSELMKLLQDGEGESGQQLKVISIFGFGGIGKTTLANQIYCTFGERFKYRAFVSVSQNPDVMKILRVIYSQVSKQGYDRTETGDERQLIDNILKFLKDKRYFIVVDDVWTAEAWEVIKCAFPKNSFGSRIITTTRIKGVAELCCSSYVKYVYELRPLSFLDSKRLFLKRIFNLEEQCPPHLNRISDNILKRCGGLPLAIITISGLLASKSHTVGQWIEVQNSIGSTIERCPSVERMMKILSLSFFDLPDYLRTCLLYLSIFPEDYFIEKNRLVRRWVAEGFIHGKYGHNLYDIGDRYFNELINRSLIQPAYINNFGEVETCRVHDIVLDFIVGKSIEDNFATLIGGRHTTIVPEYKVRRLALQYDSKDVISQPNLIFSHVRSITVFGQTTESLSMVKSRYLRVLDFKGFSLAGYHLQNMGTLCQLKYLSLENTSITELPEQLGEFHNLETLNLDGTRIVKLPSTIVQLERLVHLLIRSGVKLPDGISNMKALQELGVIGLGNQSRSILQEIGQLPNMIVLTIHWDDKAYDFLNTSGTKFAQHVNLHSSSININCESADTLLHNSPHGSGNIAPSSLRKLVIMGQFTMAVPMFETLRNLQKLAINVKDVTHDHLWIYGGLPVLLHLDLHIKSQRVHICKLEISNNHGFTSLKHFLIGGENLGLGLMFKPGSMPNLQELALKFDSIETDRLINLGLAFGIEHLTCLTSIDCDIYSLGEILPSSKAVMVAMERVVSAHQNHPKLAIRILG